MEKVGDLEIGEANDPGKDESKRNLNEMSTKTREHDGGEDIKNQDDDESSLSGDDAEDLLDDPLDVVPPDFVKAKKHQDANRVKNIDEDAGNALYDNEEDFCECCQLPTSKAAPPFKICTSIFSLEDLGSGFPLYYQFKKFIFGIYLLMSLMFGICAIIQNLDHDEADQWIEEASPTPILKHTMGNRGVFETQYDDNDMIVQVYLNYGVIIIVLVIANILRWRQLAIEKKIDEKNITPADFTVFTMNLPKDCKPEDVKEFFETYHKKYKFEVSKVNFCYDIRDVVHKVRRLEKWNKIRNYNNHKAEQIAEDKGISKEEAAKKISDFDKAERKAQRIAEQIEVLKKDMNSKDKGDYFCQRAFVTFSDQKTSARVVKRFDMFYFVKMVWFVWYEVFKCKKEKDNHKFLKGNRIIVERATEPGDVYWENIPVTDFERLLRQLLTYFITACCLGAAFGIYFGLNRLGRHLEDNAEDGASSGDLWLIRIVNLLSAVITMVVNVLLDIIIRLLSSYEKHRSYTHFHLSVAIKLMASTFINSALLPLFNNLDKKDWFTNNGVAMTIFYNSISVSFVSTLLYLFNIGYLIKKFKICWEMRKGAESKMTQRQANELFEGPKVDMAMLYSRTGMLYLLICFYTPLVPGIAFIGTCGIFVQYWVEKYLLLRRHKVPEAMGSAMAKFYSSLIPMGMVLYAIGNYVFVNELSDGKNSHGQWILWFMIAYYVLPIGFIINIFTVKVERDDKLKYEDAKFAFVQDYDRVNPMTENSAKAAYLKELKEKMGDDDDDDERKEIEDEMAKAEGQTSIFKSLSKYGKKNKGLETNKFDFKYKKAKKDGKSKKKKRKAKKRDVPNKYLQKMNKKFNKKKGKTSIFDKLAIKALPGTAKKGQVLPFAGNKESVHEHNDSDVPIHKSQPQDEEE